VVERWSTRIKTVGYSFERREIGNRALAWRRVYLITVSPACNYWAILRMFTSTASSHSNRPSSSSSPSSSRVAWVFRCVIPHPFTWSRMIGFHRTRIHTHTHTYLSVGLAWCWAQVHRCALRESDLSPVFLPACVDQWTVVISFPCPCPSSPTPQLGMLTSLPVITYLPADADDPRINAGLVDSSSDLTRGRGIADVSDHSCPVTLWSFR